MSLAPVLSQNIFINFLNENTSPDLQRNISNYLGVDNSFGYNIKPTGSLKDLLNMEYKAIVVKNSNVTIDKERLGMYFDEIIVKDVNEKSLDSSVGITAVIKNKFVFKFPKSFSIRKIFGAGFDLQIICTEKEIPFYLNQDLLAKIFEISINEDLSYFILEPTIKNNIFRMMYALNALKYDSILERGDSYLLEQICFPETNVTEEVDFGRLLFKVI